MTVFQAINRIVFRFKQLKTNQLDQEALDCLVDYINIQDESGYMENLLFAKLFMERFMILASTGKYSASDCLSIIMETLRMPANEIIKKYVEQVPFFKFEHTTTKYMRPVDPFNFEAIRRERLRVAKDHEKELLACLRTKYTEEQAIGFLKNQVNILNNQFNRKEYA